MTLLTIQEPIKTQETNKEAPVIGIDLGTTNSLVGVIEGENLRLFADEDGQELHKSVVAFDEKGNVVATCNKAFSGDFATKIFSIKRLMGKGIADLENLRKEFDFKFDESASNQGELLIAIGEKKFSATQISSEILRCLKELAVKELNLSEESAGKLKAVITVPAYFDEAAKNATKLAAKLAGIEVLRLVNEPTAAALAYGLDNSAEGIFAIYDLGGGTFDVSILKMTKGVFKVLGVAGNNALGGDDFDLILAQKLGISKNQAQEIKEKLSVQDEIEIVQDGNDCADFGDKNLDAEENENEDFADEIKIAKLDENDKKTPSNSSKKSQASYKTKAKITRDEFNELIAPQINKTIDLTRNLLDDLDIEACEIKGLVLVGGSSRIPLIRQKLTEIFDKAQILTDLDPDRVVAAGATWQAYNLSGRGGDNLLLDVLPLSLGVEMMGGIVDKIITRNTTIPAAFAKEFTTYADNQTGIKLHIVQGEREFARDNRSLAEFEIKKIPPMKAGLARVLVTFKVDADGLLTVLAEEKFTCQKQEIIVKPSFGLDEAQIKKMLLDSMKNAKTDMKARLDAEAISEAAQNLEILKRDLAQYPNLVSKKERNTIGKDIVALEKLLQEKADRHLVEKAQAKLEKTSENFILQKVNDALKYYVSKKIDEV